MKCSVKYDDLAFLLKRVQTSPGPGQRREKQFMITAYQDQLYIACNDRIVGAEASVDAEGQCIVARKMFQELLLTFKDRKSISLTANEKCITISGFPIAVKSYKPHAENPVQLKQDAIRKSEKKKSNKSENDYRHSEYERQQIIKIGNLTEKQVLANGPAVVCPSCGRYRVNLPMPNAIRSTRYRWVEYKENEIDIPEVREERLCDDCTTKRHEVSRMTSKVRCDHSLTTDEKFKHILNGGTQLDLL